MKINVIDRKFMFLVVILYECLKFIIVVVVEYVVRFFVEQLKKQISFFKYFSSLLICRVDLMKIRIYEKCDLEYIYFYIVVNISFWMRFIM